MSSRTIVRSMRRGLSALLVVALCVSQVSVIWAGNFRNGAVGGVSINVDGVVRTSFVHYTSPAEITRLINALDKLLLDRIHSGSEMTCQSY